METPELIELARDRAKESRVRNGIRVRAGLGSARRTRRRARLTLKEIADTLGVSVSTVWRWENGEQAPRGDLAVRYRELLEALAS